MKLDAHYQLTRLAIALGPSNPFVRVRLRAACRQYGVSLRFTGSVLELVKADHVIRISARQFGYAPSLAVKYDHYFEQVEPSVVDGNQVVDYSAPKLQRYRVSGLEFEVTSVPEEEDAIEEYFHWYRPAEGDVVFDLGAYCGLSTYCLSRSVGASGRVYAFEPDATSHALLLANIARHQLLNVIPLQLGVAGTTGRAEFLAEGTLGSVLSRHSSRATMGKVSDVETITLAGACDRYGVPAFIKMDIEGSEIEVLDSARELLRSTPIQFALDTDHLIDGKMTTAKVEQIFRESGYETLSSDRSGFMTTWARPPLPANGGIQS